MFVECLVFGVFGVGCFQSSVLFALSLCISRQNAQGECVWLFRFLGHVEDILNGLGSEFRLGLCSAREVGWPRGKQRKQQRSRNLKSHHVNPARCSIRSLQWRCAPHLRYNSIDRKFQAGLSYPLEAFYFLMVCGYGRVLYRVSFGRVAHTYLNPPADTL